VGALFVVLVGTAVAWWAWQKSKRRTHPVPPGYQPDVELPHEREFELYHNALSLCSMKTRVCLAELRIPYASHHVDLIETGAYENLRPRLLSVNPGGTVPVLLHRGHPVYESHEQIRYLAGNAPPGSPSLTPEAPALRVEMERWVDRSSLTADPLEHGDESAGNAVPGLTVPLFAAMIEHIPTWKILEGFLFHFDRKRPLVFGLLKLRGLEKLAGIAPAMKALSRSRRQMAAHLDSLEKQLSQSGGPCLLGETFSLADVSWLVIFERLVQADLLHVFLGGGRRTACADWWERLKARDSYREAILGHAHATVLAGTRRLREAKAADPALRLALEGS
jgi:glutathione S-transferase